MLIVNLLFFLSAGPYFSWRQRSRLASFCRTVAALCDGNFNDVCRQGLTVASLHLWRLSAHSLVVYQYVRGGSLIIFIMRGVLNDRAFYARIRIGGYVPRAPAQNVRRAK